MLEKGNKSYQKCFQRIHSDRLLDLGSARRVSGKILTIPRENKSLCFRTLDDILSPRDAQEGPGDAQGHEKSAQRAPKDPHNSNLKMKKHDFLATLILIDPTLFWHDFAPFWEAWANEKA